MPCGQVPVLFATWHLWVFSSVKSEIQQNTNGLLQCPGFLAQVFGKLEWPLTLSGGGCQMHGPISS